MPTGIYPRTPEMYIGRGEKISIAKLANMLNSVAAEIAKAEEDLTGAQLRIAATKRSILVIQDGIFQELNKEVKGETQRNSPR